MWEAPDLETFVGLLSARDAKQLAYFVRALRRVIETGKPQVIAPKAPFLVAKAQLVRTPEGVRIIDAKKASGVSPIPPHTWIVLIPAPVVDQFAAMLRRWSDADLSALIWDAYRDSLTVLWGGEPGPRRGTAADEITALLRSEGLA